MKKQSELKVTWIPTYEGAVLNAIKEAMQENRVIVKIGLPIRIQREIMKEMPKGKKLKQLFGIKVEQARTMQITTEFYRILRNNMNHPTTVKKKGNKLWEK